MKDKMPEFSRFLKARTGWSFKVKGTYVKSEGKGQTIELLCEDPSIHSVEVCGEVQNPKTYPISKKYQKPETLREHCHLRPRTNLIGGVARVRNALAFATHIFFQSRGYLYVHTPIITASDCEGAGEMFQVTTILPEPGLPFNPK